MDKKAQIQIFETIAVVFVFFILVAVGIIFYVKVIKSNVQTENEGFSQDLAVAIAQRAIFLPEIQCSQDNLIKDKCVDILKLKSTEPLMKANEIDYFDLFEFSDIKIHQVYPTENAWNLYSRKTSDFTNKFVTNISVSTYDPNTKSYGFGTISIETLTK